MQVDFVRISDTHIDASPTPLKKRVVVRSHAGEVILSAVTHPQGIPQLCNLVPQGLLGHAWHEICPVVPVFFSFSSYCLFVCLCLLYYGAQLLSFECMGDFQCSRFSLFWSSAVRLASLYHLRLVQRNE